MPQLCRSLIRDKHGAHWFVNDAVKGTIIWVTVRLIQRESRGKADGYIPLTSAAPLPIFLNGTIPSDQWKPSLS